MQAVSRVLVLVALLASACSAIRVRTNSAPDVDFTQYRTFVVAEGEVMQPNRTREPADGPAEARIRKGIADQLRAKGLVPTGDTPDLIATFVIGTEERTEIEPYAPPYGGWAFGPWGPRGWWGPGWWGPVYPQWWTRTYVQGTLVIDLIDARTNRAVWRAYARAELSGPNLDPEIDRAVAKAFEDYPPSA